MDLVQYDDAFAAFHGAAARMSGDTKSILKFDKGDWYLGQDKEEIAKGTRFAVNMMEAQTGWILWHDKKVDDRRMVLVASGQAPSPRSELGHSDQQLWDRGDDGKPIDPWSQVIEIPARELIGEQREVMLSGSSRGWEGCCKALFKAFGTDGRANAGKTPIVELGSDKYTHPKYGIVKVPMLNLVEWRDLSAPAKEVTKKAAKF